MYHAGLLFGLLTGTLVGIAVLVLLFKKKVLNMEFDERQQRARGKAALYGFTTLLVVLYIYGISEIALGRWCDALAGVSLCIAIGLGVFAVTCILNDAYLGLKEKPRQIMTMFALVTFFNLGLGGLYLSSGGLVVDGVLTYRVANPVLGFMALAILLVYIVNFLLRDREQAE